jgi:hypothetical protein
VIRNRPDSGCSPSRSHPGAQGSARSNSAAAEATKSGLGNRSLVLLRQAAHGENAWSRPTQRVTPMLCEISERGVCYDCDFLYALVDDLAQSESA